MAAPVEAHAQLSAKDEGMLQFVADAWNDRECFKSEVQLPDDVLECFDWMQERSEKDAMLCREAVISAIEHDASAFIASGQVEAWFSNADASVRQVACGFNGPLLEMLLRTCKHVDPGCADLFRQGAPLLGKLPMSGIGTPEQKRSHESIDKLWATAAQGNGAILKKLHEDKHSQELFSQTVQEATLGRMTMPRPIEEFHLGSLRFSQRFSVEQGSRPDGSIKVRCVDGCTESGINPCTEPAEHLKLDSLDFLLEAMRATREFSGSVPHPFKVDIDSAYRRVPVAPRDRWAAHVVFKDSGTTFVAGHLAMPFGATSSVHSWCRVGAALVRILRVVLKIPVGIYVDDLHGAERPACIAHTTNCVVRLIRAVLGPSSVANHKVAHGLPMDLLGVTVDACQSGVSFTPTEGKIVDWCHQIRCILQSKQLTSGVGKKLAGKLSWSGQVAFGRLGRALLRPLFQIRRGKSWSQLLESALQWWLEVLSLQIYVERPWAWPSSRPVQIFCDAAGSPARLAAIIFTEDGQTLYTDAEPPPPVLEFFIDRADNQICSLEICAIALGLSTFGEFCIGRNVHIWSDNSGSENAVRRGSATAWDHNMVVHAIWVKAAMLKCHLRVDRVPTELNIADLPSRGSYSLLRAVNARCVQPVLDKMFWEVSAWDTLMLQRGIN